MVSVRDFRSIHLAMQSLVEHAAASGEVLDVHAEGRQLMTKYPEADMTQHEVEVALAEIATAAGVALLLNGSSASE